MAQREITPRRRFEVPASFSVQELEGFLSDISAETFLLEAERLRTRRRISALSAGGATVEDERLISRDQQIEERLEELEARTAALRGRLEQLQLGRA